jgi:hypothetical protein
MNRLGSLLLSLALLSSPALAVAADSTKENKVQKATPGKHSGRRHHARAGGGHKPTTGEPKPEK